MAYVSLFEQVNITFAFTPSRTDTTDWMIGVSVSGGVEVMYNIPNGDGLFVSFAAGSGYRIRAIERHNDKITAQHIYCGAADGMLIPTQHANIAIVKTSYDLS